MCLALKYTLPYTTVDWDPWDPLVAGGAGPRNFLGSQTINFPRVPDFFPPLDLEVAGLDDMRIIDSGCFLASRPRPSLRTTVATQQRRTSGQEWERVRMNLNY